MDIELFLQLIRQYEGRSTQAFMTLWEVFFRPVIQTQLSRRSILGPFCLLEDRQKDCEQDIAAAVMRDLPDYRQRWEKTLTTQTPPPKLEPWLHVVVQRKAIDWLRKQPEIKRSRDQTCQVLDYSDPHDLLMTMVTSTEGVGGLLEKLMLQQRVAPILAWARSNLPPIELHELCEYLLHGVHQSKAARRALEKLRREFRGSNAEEHRHA